MYQLLIAFKKAYFSAMREGFYNTVIEFGISMKVIRLIKCV